jgi:hypothetical protein
MTENKVNSPLFFLLSRSLGNAVLVRVKRLRQPKYFAGALFGAAYFYFYFYRLMSGSAGRPRPEPATGLAPARDAESRRARAFAALILLAWVLRLRARRSLHRGGDGVVAPAPFARSQLISYKLLKSQFGLLLMPAADVCAGDWESWIHTFGGLSSRQSSSID